MKDELASKLSSDEAHLLKVKMQIAQTLQENEDKNRDINLLKKKIRDLSAKFKSLLELRIQLTNRIESLKREIWSKKAKEAENLRIYEESKKQSTRQKEIDLEVQLLKSQIAELDKKIAALKAEIDELDDQLVIIEERIRLKIEINRKRREADKMPEYIPDKSDPADIRIAKYLNVDDTRVPIKRLDKGLYMFGRKKIQVTANDRQEGGYQVFIPSENKTISIEHLLTKYADDEIKTLSKIREDQELVVGDGEATVRAALSPNRKSEATWG